MKIKIDKINLTMSISILIVCTILVCVLFIQFKTVEKVNESDIENMRETQLQEQISMWKSKYEETNEKLEEVKTTINEYNNKLSANEESSELLNAELLKSNILLGKTNVSGEGVVITLEDNDEAKIESSDLLELLNELRFAGAEAISINGIRITSMSEIVDIADKYILVSPRQRISSPYIIKAIGNQTYLVSTLSLKNSGYIDLHSNVGQTVKLEKQKNVQIPKYTESIDIKYMKEVTGE